MREETIDGEVEVPTTVCSPYDQRWQDILLYLKDEGHVPRGVSITKMTCEVSGEEGITVSDIEFVDYNDEP